MSDTSAIRRQLFATLTSAPFDLRPPSAPVAFTSPATAAERLTLRNACVLEAPAVRVAGELDLTPDLLVVDYGLATIGLVHIVAASDVAVADQAKRHVDQATYLRHLLVTGGVTAGDEGFALHYTVECVLVMDEATAERMVAVVRDIATRTRLLHATGLNVLKFSSPAAFDSVSLRRAFAWLLPAARQRLLACAPATARLRELSLLNYRLPGLRPWTLSADRVHLLHGPNGTGKSSIAEALELVVTGSVERLKVDPQADYAGIILNRDAANRDAAGAATVTLTVSSGPPREFTVVPSGIAEPALYPGLPASAFRLDQTVMDHLVRSDSQQRARIFTQSFFPGPAYSELGAAQQQFDADYRQLPPELQEEIRTATPDPNKWASALQSRLQWVDSTEAPIEALADCLPLKREHMDALGRIVPEVTDSLEGLGRPGDRATFDAHLHALDEALGRLRQNARRYWEAVIESLNGLSRLSAWAPAAGDVRLRYSELLRRWADRVALSDMLKRHLEISRTLLAARDAGWTPAAGEPTGLLAVPGQVLRASIDGLNRAAEESAREQADYFAQLQSASPTAPAGDQPSSLTALSAGEIASLNLVGAWFSRTEPTPSDQPLGDTVQQALSENTFKVCGTITIGSQAWTTRLSAFLEPLKPALEALLAFEAVPGAVGQSRPGDGTRDVPIYRSPVVRLEAYRNVLASARLVATALDKVEQTLMRRLAEHKLNEALDEVVALFTPARWAYEGLLVRPKVRDGKVSMELLTSETESAADMRLNTAELNLVVLALYLLCGPTIDNPLGTVILDDPLQNMDELTAATVARGLSKLAALLPDGWQLMLLFHGEEDLQTFRREVPGAVYYLPWLGPIGAGRADGNGVLTDARRHEAVVATQTLDSVIRLHDRTATAPDAGRP